MLFIAHWLVIFVFWFFLAQLARKDGYKLPALFALLWIAGYFLFPLLFPSLGLSGGLYFTSYGAVLSLILIYVDMTRETMGLRHKSTSPLEENSSE